MGPMAIGALIGAGLGALKSQEEKNNWADQQQAEAEMTRYGTWTGQHGKNLAPPTGDLGNIMAGAGAGAAVGQGWDHTDTGGGEADAAGEIDDSGVTTTNGIDETRLPDNYYRKQQSDMQNPFVDYESKNDRRTLYG